MKNSKGAFTLAEVLITLGIIGIVAALTLPSLIENHNKKVWVTALQKFYSTQQQGFQKMLADDGVDSLSETRAFGAIGGTQCHNSDSPTSSNCKDFYDLYKKYFNVVDIKNSADFNYTVAFITKGSISKYPTIDGMGPSGVMVMSDGSFIINYKFYKEPIESPYTCEYIKSMGKHFCKQIGIMSIDVNGKKKPNIEGRDMFDFDIGDDGKLYPFWSLEDSYYATGTPTGHTWRLGTRCGTPGKADAETVGEYGSGCAARIIDNGWVMDY